MSLLVPVSWGELLDKIAILQIKSERMSDPAKIDNVRYELTLLEGVRDDSVRDSPELDDLVASLKEVNEALWEIEDDIRSCERAGDFGPGFVELARSVYHNNDRRAALKYRINLLLGSDVVEEKSYQPYIPGEEQ